MRSDGRSYPGHAAASQPARPARRRARRGHGV